MFDCVVLVVGICDIHVEVCTLYGAFKSGMCYALKRAFGLTFNLMLLAAIPVGLCAVVLLMPVLVYVCTSVAAVKSQLMGDPFGLPSFVTVLFLCSIPSA